MAFAMCRQPPALVTNSIVSAAFCALIVDQCPAFTGTGDAVGVRGGWGSAWLGIKFA